VEIFYLGTHQPNWLEETAEPLFVARQRLAERKTLPRALGPWALDSGGFNELRLHGRWRITAAQYAREVRRFMEIGNMNWAAPLDWMCEPLILKATGLTVAEHQWRTLRNFLELREIAPELPWIPVLQGWGMGDYYEHANEYERAGVNLLAEPIVGVGTVCRRQGTLSVSAVLGSFHDEGMRLHGFGYKRTGLKFDQRFLVSADSLAWSKSAFYAPRIPGHTHKSCSNCIEYAEEWRAETLDALDLPGPTMREVRERFERKPGPKGPALQVPRGRASARLAPAHVPPWREGPLGQLSLPGLPSLPSLPKARRRV